MQIVFWNYFDSTASWKDNLKDRKNDVRNGIFTTHAVMSIHRFVPLHGVKMERCFYFFILFIYLFIFESLHLTKIVIIICLYYMFFLPGYSSCDHSSRKVSLQTWRLYIHQYSWNSTIRMASFYHQQLPWKYWYGFKQHLHTEYNTYWYVRKYAVNGYHWTMSSPPIDLS